MSAMSHQTGPKGQLTRIAAALAALALSSPAAAQAPVAIDRAASDGVERPIHDYSGEGDASSLELNPALLSAMKGLDAVIMGYSSTSAFTRGTGFGTFLGLNLGLGFAAAFGVQRLRPGLGASVVDPRAAQNPDFTKLSFGLSGGDGKFAAVGLGVHWMLDRGQTLRRPDLDLGLLLRIRNYASLGAVARLGPADLSTTTFPGGDLPAELSVTGEFAVRPLGTRMLELAGGVRTRWRSNPSIPTPQVGEYLGVLPRGRVAFRYQGLEIAGELEQVRAHRLDLATSTILADAKALRGSVAVALSWDLLTVRAGMHTGISPGVDGFGLAARFSSARQGRVFWPRLVDAERIDLATVRGERALIKTLERLERAEQAGPRAILLVDARSTNLGWASAQELRSALVRVRNAGGHVFAYLEGSDLKDYYLASAAEQVFIHPAGELATFGLSSTTLYFKSALEKLGVQVEGLYINEYKSAHERFTRTGPSDFDRQQREAILDDTYAQILADIAQARGLAQNQVRGLIDESPHGPQQALARKLIDKVVHRDEVIESISSAVGSRVRFTSFADTDPELPTWSTAPYTAVVLVEGTIIDGESRTIPFLNIQFAGAETLIKQLRTLRGDPMCKGIVLRVNSPGGSALASDLIWREVARTHEAHEKTPRKSPPIVVSMGDVAASGGYYVAMGARQIFAQPTTITGSIGVVSLHFDVSGMLAKLGISTSTFSRGKNADIASFYKPFSDDQRARMDASIRRVYDLFRQRVADGRKLTLDRVDELGRGHVYSGSDALELKLVDQFGGLREAVAAVRSKAGVPARQDLELRVFPRQRRLVDLLLEQVLPKSGDNGLQARIDAQREAKQQLPLALSAAIARLPLALLFLPPDEALALLPGMVEVE
jgi:protease-4